MYIKELVLDGFKTYSRRTVIEGFDIHFNAITGMNGSGKSNILDSICFVLGIATLSTLRVNNMKELIYKNGHAGIVKANVSLVFDNTDKSRSPEQYMQHDTITVRREVKIDGSTRYTMNGTKATTERVKQFFCMVGLNVNNATFVIMQGHITKVASHRPKELLRQIEEAAGIAMYERQKQNSLRLLAKKEAKLQNINQIIDDELQPKITQLQTEKTAYLEWKTRSEECNKLEEQLAYAEYQSLITQKANAADLLVNYRKQRQDYESTVEASKTEIVRCQNIKKELLSSIPNMEADDQEIASLKENIEAVNSAIVTQDDIIAKATKKVTELTKKIQGLENDIPAKEGELMQIDQSIASLITKIQDTKENIENIHEEQAKGETDVDGHINHFAKQESKLRTRIDEANAKAEALNDNIENDTANLNKKQALQEKAQATVQEYTAKIEQLTEEIGRLEADQLKRKSLSNEDRISELSEQQRSLQEEQKKIGHELRQKGADKLIMQQNIVDPRKIYGPVIRNIKLKNDKHAYALEAIAGGKLFSVLVDNDATAAKLLEQHKRSYFPESKMQPSNVDQKVVSAIKKKYGNKANLAIDCIQYSADVGNSMSNLFGRVFICESKEQARDIAMGSWRMPAVTIEGDFYSPTGELSGGVNVQNRGSRILDVANIAKMENRLNAVNGELGTITQQLNSMQEDQRLLNNVQNEIHLKQNNIKQMQHEIKNSSYEKLTEDIKALSRELERNEGLLRAARDEARDLTKELTKLEKQKDQMTKTDMKTYLTKELATHTKAQQKLEKELAKQEKLKNELASSVEVSKGDLIATREEAEAESAQVDAEKVKGEQLFADRNAKQEQYVAKQRELDAMLLERSNIKQEIDEIDQKITKTHASIEKIENDIKRIVETIDQTEKAANGSTEIIDKLLEKFPWLDQENSTRLTQITSAQQGPTDLNELREQFEAVKADVTLQEKTINKRVMGTLDDSENRYKELMEKRSILLSDKEQINDALAYLEEKKQSTIRETFEKVNKNFNKIFQSLLVGAHAKLQTVNDGPIEDGLEIKVGFNGVWKANLGELSGGQRSLLALSFVLSLLKYSPAPLYILDEIDSALDLSHTQNIGDMLQKCFDKSQFLVISLKENMFSNANVLYKVRFEDGHSVVERHTLNNDSQVLRG